MGKKNKAKIKARAVARLTNYCLAHGIELKTRREIVEFAEKKLGITPPKRGQKRSTLDCRLEDAYRVASGKDKRSGGKKSREVKRDKVDAFYKSYEWRKIRYNVLEANDGRCECCGRSKHDGIVLHVDHIKPLRKNWKLRLRESNLQILCNECNHGKGNRFETDWREPSLKVLMGEEVE